MSELIVVLGPTAVGKTKLAAHFSRKNRGEVISADSRQVYKGMDIGSGKDIAEFSFPDGNVPYHLIDILDAGTHYDLFQFQQDFYKAYNTIVKRDKLPILCGGSGLYIEAALAKEKMQFVPKDSKLRKSLSKYNQAELVEQLKKLKPEQHNTTDTLDVKRTIRAIEIASFEQLNQKPSSPIKKHTIFGINMERSELRERIKERLQERIDQGMIEEVEQLIKNGLTTEQLQYYGLEYRFIALYLNGELNKLEFFEKLLQSIRRFAKKQMTWYRRMERKGYEINWMPAAMPIEEKIDFMELKVQNGK